MFTGPWINIVTPPKSMWPDWEKAKLTGTTVHDDEKARELGYKSAFVGGLTLFAAASPAIFASFGHQWYESGAYSVRYTDRVYEKGFYDGEALRAVWEEAKPDPGDRRKIVFRAEDRNGEACAVGWAAIGEPGGNLTPPWERAPVLPVPPPLEAAEDLAPMIRVGSVNPPVDVRTPKNEMAYRADVIDDHNWWHRFASPWGDPILPPWEIAFMPLTAGRRQQEQHPSSEFSSPPRLPALMDNGKDVVVYGPVFAERTYRLQSRTCEKEHTKPYFYWVNETTIDDETGRRVAVLRERFIHLMKFVKPA